MIVVGDLHLQDREPYRTAALSVLDYIAGKDEDFVFTGDFIHSNNISIEKTLLPALRKLGPNRIWICSGNHDRDRRGSLLSLPGIRYIVAPMVFTISGVRTAFYPYSKTKPDRLQADLHIAHFSPAWYAFDFDRVDWDPGPFTIYGHVHDHEVRGNDVIIGSPYPTNFAEKNNPGFIYKSDSGLEELPRFLNFEDVEIGQEPTAPKPRILSVKAITSKDQALAHYPDEYIHWPSSTFITKAETKANPVIDLRTFCQDYEMEDAVRAEILRCL